jgi:two-component system CheB/CheR fusion protein
VLFADRGPPLSLEEAAAGGQGSRDGDHTVEQLQRELRDTRERLQSTIEEYETGLEELKSSHEEMVSMNEELQSTNEEMETSREELQSVNEELQTVNLELSRKVEALDQANNDLRNLFESTQIATVFLDRELTIRSFTPAMTAIFNLIPSDKGRPLTDIVSRIEYPDLPKDIQAVFDGAERRERRIQRSDGTIHYLARVLPYRTAEGTLGGVVVTFVDVTKAVRGEEYRTLADELNHRVRNMLTVVIGLARQTLADAPDLKTGTKTFAARLHAMARAYNLLSKKEWGEVPLHDIVTVELDPYILAERKRVRVEGPDIQLTPKAALAIGFAVHELATNAAKYGALSAAGGDVDITWSVDGEAGARRLMLDWRERGGPMVVEPTRKGFGTRLIEQQIGHGLGGEVDIAFVPDGLHARLAFLLNRRTGASEGPDS